MNDSNEKRNIIYPLLGIILVIFIAGGLYYVKNYRYKDTLEKKEVPSLQTGGQIKKIDGSRIVLERYENDQFKDFDYILDETVTYRVLGQEGNWYLTPDYALAEGDIVNITFAAAENNTVVAIDVNKMPKPEPTNN